MSQGFLKEVQRLFQERFNDVSGRVPGSFNYVSRESQECFKGVQCSRKIEGCLYELWCVNGVLNLV